MSVNFFLGHLHSLTGKKNPSSSYPYSPTQRVKITNSSHSLLPFQKCFDIFFFLISCTKLSVAVLNFLAFWSLCLYKRKLTQWHETTVYFSLCKHRHFTGFDFGLKAATKQSRAVTWTRKGIWSCWRKGWATSMTLTPLQYEGERHPKHPQELVLQ